MVGRFSIRRVAAPDLAPVEDAVTAVDIAPPVVVAPPPEPANPLLSEKLLDAKVRLHRRLIEEINLSALEKLPVEGRRARMACWVYSANSPVSATVRSV